tara:strand:- start:930 stop:1283 length:354 start_codon:yes stop_codon:yes gene_type:complete
MKIECLLPTLLAAHAPFGDYQAGEQIRDHDAALGYVLTFDTDALPSYADLPLEQRSPVCFTQAELSYAPRKLNFDESQTLIHLSWLHAGSTTAGSCRQKRHRACSSPNSSSCLRPEA